MDEYGLTRKVLRYLRSKGGFWEKRSPGAFGKVGVADITGCYRGRFVAIELKAPGRYPYGHIQCSAAQRKYLERVDDAGGISLLTDNLADIQATLERIDNEESV